MAAGPVAQILFRTAIAAVNNDSHLRVYTQDVFGGIRESLYESGWANGTINNVIAKGKLGTPIAATSRALQEIRVYYISEDNKLREHAYSSGKGWYNGALSSKNYSVAPYSKVSATFLPGSNVALRVYAQSPDNTIQEYGWDNGSTGWQVQSNLGNALPGTEIAATSYTASSLRIRVYLQNPSLAIIEKAYDAGGSGWYTGGFSVPSAPPRTSLSVASLNTSSGGSSLRVYYGTAENTIQEKAWDGGWNNGGFKVPSLAGSESAVITWGSGSSLQLRVYLQNGTDVSAVSEWVWSGGWTRGHNALPPA